MVDRDAKGTYYNLNEVLKKDIVSKEMTEDLCRRCHCHFFVPAVEEYHTFKPCRCKKGRSVYPAKSTCDDYRYFKPRTKRKNETGTDEE